MKIYSVLVTVSAVSCFIIFKNNSSLYIAYINENVMMSYSEMPVNFIQKDRDPGNVYLKNGDNPTYTLDIRNGQTDIVFAKFHGRYHQVFSLVRNEDGSFSIKSSQDGRCLEVVEDRKLEPTTCRKNVNQRFDIYEPSPSDYKPSLLYRDPEYPFYKRSLWPSARGLRPSFSF